MGSTLQTIAYKLQQKIPRLAFPSKDLKVS